MSISLKSMETERRAGEVAAKTAEWLTGAIRASFKGTAGSPATATAAKAMASPLQDILRRVDQWRVLDSRTPDEIVGYDAHGLPH